MNRDLFAERPAASRPAPQDNADRGLFVGLPTDFPTPEKVALHIASLNTIAEREAFWLQLPKRWQGPFIGHFVELAIAARIVDMPVKAERQDALASVPDIWRESVKWQVLRMWRRRAAEEVGEAVYYQEQPPT